MSFGQALQDLLGGQQQQADYQDFINRYHNGPPAQGYSDQEVMQRYGQIAPQLPPQDYQQAATAAFERMSPQERQQFAQYVQQAAQQQGLNVPQMGGNMQRYQDPGALAQMTTQVHQQQPDFLQQMFGQGGALGSPVAKAALAGIAAMAAQRVLGGGGGFGGGIL